MKTKTQQQTEVQAPDPQRDWWTPLKIHEVPKWLQDNHHIHSGYRQASHSYVRSLTSALHVHNETVNIWSHGVPALLSLPTATILYHTLEPRYAAASQPDVIVMGIFFCSVALAMGMSATFHALSNHSPAVAKFWNQLDYAGISCLIAGSFVPSVYYGFWCDAKRQVVYWTMISVLGMGCTAVSVLPCFRTPDWRPFRAAMFIGMGLSAVIPVVDGLRLYSLEVMLRQMGLGWVVLQGTLYIFGAVLYALRWPERQYPGEVDLVGSSHQIFHVCVVLAAMSHLRGLLVAFDYRHGLNGATCP